MSILDNICDLFRNILPYYITLLIPLFIIISPIDPIKAAQDFTAYRLQQLDIQSTKIGSRSSLINLEAQVTLNKIRGRKCLLLKLVEVSVSTIKMAISQNAGAVIILMPAKSNWNHSIREHIYALENEMLKEEFSIPIYFSYETNKLLNIYENIKKIDEFSSSVSAAKILANSVLSHGYQFYTTYHESKPITDMVILNIFGKLSGNGIEEQLPTILIVAHYDSMGLAPSMSYGYDSNASGVVALLQLMRLFSKLYAFPKAQGKYNLAFLLSGGGKLNYVGTKKWLDEFHDHSDIISSDNIAMVLCLESLGGSNNLFAHVSKPPKNNTPGQKFINFVQQTLSESSTSRSLQLIHKKINLISDDIRWEHERFSLKNVAAMTLAARSSHINKNSILDDNLSLEVLINNTKVISESLIKLIYGLESTDIPEGRVSQDDWISSESMEADFALMTKYPRSSQLLKPKHPLLTSLERKFRNLLQFVKLGKVKADPRDPEFLLYSGTEVKIMAHKVKPAVFDFLITCLVLGYLGLIYLLINNFSLISRLILQFSSGSNNVEKLKKSI